MKQIGFVGLGAMGSQMAPLPTQNGFSVIGFDVARKIPAVPGVTKANSVEDLMSCDAIITMLPDGTDVAGVSRKIAEAGFCGLIIDMSSSHPNDTIRLGHELSILGIRLIDAPVSGGVNKAASGTLMIMAGGCAKDIASAAELINCFGNMEHIGPLGAGHAMKALNNYVSAAGLLASMQALATAGSFGIAADKFTKVINGSTGRNNTTEVKIMPFIAARKYDSGFFLRLLAKDVNIASELMKNGGFDTSITPALNSYLAAAMDKLGHDADHTKVYEIINPASKYK